MKTVNVFLLAIALASLVLASAFAPGGGSVFAPALNPSGFVSTCTGQYFNNTTLSGTPALTRADAAINFFWREGTSPGPGVNVSGYSVRWTCTVNVATAGTYTFLMVADDGMNLLVDGNLLLWAWYDQGPSAYTNALYLSAGAHTLTVEYYNNTNGGTAQVSSTINGTAPSLPSGGPLTPGSSRLLSNCTGEYFNNKNLSGTPAMTRADAAVNYFWREGTSPGPGINATGYSVRWTCTVNVTTATTYTFLAVADDGMNILVDGNLLLWAWYDEGPSAYAKSVFLNAGAHTVKVEYYNNTNGGTAQVSIQ